MRQPYSQFRRRDRLPGEVFRPAYTKRRWANLLFTSQLAVTTILAALMGWQAAPEIKAWAARASRTPEQIAAVEQSVYYAGCDDAREAGVAPIYRGQAGYRQGIDGDDDGIACEPYH